MDALSIIAIGISVFAFGLLALLYRRTKDNEKELADIHMQLHDSIATVIQQVKAINEAATPFNDRLKALEEVIGDFAEELEENVKAERRFTDGVASLLNYDFSVASRPSNGRAEK
jgi:septal ring factor EnvC (AmiA/AmiB activator)